jgi:hypothetical protein
MREDVHDGVLTSCYSLWGKSELSDGPASFLGRKRILFIRRILREREHFQLVAGPECFTL